MTPAVNGQANAARPVLPEPWNLTCLARGAPLFPLIGTLIPGAKRPVLRKNRKISKLLICRYFLAPRLGLTPENACLFL